MGLILNIETATSVCSVNLARDGQVITIKESDEDKSHARLLSVFIQDILEENQLVVNDLDAVAISMGPGSYTGLRIGVSTAKGLCYGGDTKLIAVNTLESLSELALNKISNAQDYLLCPMIDARRMEVYTALYDGNGNEKLPTKAEIIDDQSFSTFLESTVIYFFGNGAAKCKETISHPNAVFLENIEASSIGMIEKSEKLFKAGHFEDVAYFEPYYLKDFIATIPKKKVF